MKPEKEARFDRMDDFCFVECGSRLGRLVGLNKIGQLYFTLANAKDIKFDKVGQVLVAFNEKTGEIALKPCAPEEYGCVTVSRNGDTKSLSISVRHVFKRFSKRSKLYSYRSELGGKIIILTPHEDGSNMNE
jgi:hypothetical protein